MIVIPVLKLNAEKIDQLAKMNEELSEVIDAFKEGESKERVLEECFDLHEATVNFMSLIANKHDIEIAGAKHFNKMKKRGYEFKDEIEIHI